MPDFEATFTSGATLQPWTDAADADRPSRQNIIADRAHLRRVGTVGVQVEVTATVAGASAPLDAALDGRTFLGMFAEHVEPQPAITQPAGQSSVQRFTPGAAGHYTFVMRRAQGGGLYMHLDVT